MKFRKGISREVREMLEKQLKENEQIIQMTKEEKRELHAWVSDGHSPYDNGEFIYDESGYPMDFISASRFVDEAVEWFSSLTEAEQDEKFKKIEYGYDTLFDEPFISVASLLPMSETDDAIPF